ILQLFSIGTFVLNQDGTRAVDGAGNPIPTYDQNTVEQFAKVFTGWVLAPALPGPADVGGTVPNYRDPMVLHKDSQGREDYHDRGPKTLLNGVQLPGGQSADQELNAAIDNIADHPNVAPFISKQLIQHLVTSNPSNAYVQRIAQVFAATRTSATQSCTSGRAGGLICEPLKAVWPAYAGIVTRISLVDRASYLLSLVPLCT